MLESFSFKCLFEQLMVDWSVTHIPLYCHRTLKMMLYTSVCTGSYVGLLCFPFSLFGPGADSGSFKYPCHVYYLMLIRYVLINFKGLNMRLYSMVSNPATSP
jgi:hypothetical protein